MLSIGVTEGRRVFANIQKYIRMGASSNFGNMFSVLGLSILLPFTPMNATQLLTANILYDLSQVAIPWDDVDEEFVQQPQKWDMWELAKFIMCIGPISSIFDYATYGIMWSALNNNAPHQQHRNTPVRCRCCSVCLRLSSRCCFCFCLGTILVATPTATPTTQACCISRDGQQHTTDAALAAALHMKGQTADRTCDCAVCVVCGPGSWKA